MDRLERAVTTATVIGFIAQIFGLGARGTAIVVVASLIGYYLVIKLFASERVPWKLPLTPAVLIASVLLAILVGALLRQHYIDSKIVDLGEATDTFNWRLRFCASKEQCIANVLADLPEKLPSKSYNPADQMFADQALGAVLRTSPSSINLLHKLYGVGDRFVGAGQSLAANEIWFTSQRIPEFVVPNYRDDHAGALVWRLDSNSELLNHTLQELINSDPQGGPTRVAQTRTQIIDHENSTDRPSLIRFAMVPDIEDRKQQYSGCFGLPERRRVFFSSLKYMLNNTVTVGDAANLSGYQFTPQPQNQYLYVFMFVPANASEIFVPTWRSLVTDAKEQLLAKPKCSLPRG